MPELPLIIQADELNSALSESSANKLLIIDLCSEKVYLQAHVPGAIHLPPSQLLGGKQPATGKLPKPHQLSEVFSQIGLTPDTHVIAYDDEGGGWAGRFIWTLDVIGHKHYSYLDGGIHAWLAEGLPTDSQTPAVTPSNYNINETQESVIADLAYVLENHKKENVVIWDARSKEEYTGARALAKRGGRIPGAVHYEWTSAMDRNNSLKLRDLETVKQELTDIGITKDKEIITHCQTHHRSGFTYLLGKILGFNIKAYAGSWSEWGNEVDTPVESDV